MRGDNLTSGRLLARNSLWNLVGNAAPLAAAALSIPVLVRDLGTARFGLLTLAWAFIGYLGLFDLGLGRSLTKAIADRLGDGRAGQIPSIVATGFVLLLGLGTAGGLLGASISGWLVRDVLDTPIALHREGRLSFVALSLALPVVVGTAGLRGVLAAYQRFDLVNLVRIPLGVFIYLSPLAVLPFTDSLLAVVLVLVGGRTVVLATYAALCRRALPWEGSLRFDAAAARELVAFGRWLTVSNVVGPLLSYLDRFLIGAIVTVALVAYYTTPYEIVTKLWLVPSAILAVLFPAFTTTFPREPGRTARLLRMGLGSTYLILAPVTVLAVTLAPEGLSFWLGEEFASRSAVVLQLLVVGVLVNSMAQIVSALVQGVGRPDITAKLHLGELVLYWPLLWFLVHRWGLAGAAAGWLLRVSVDGIALLLVMVRLLPPARSIAARATAGLLLSAGVAAGAARISAPVPRLAAGAAGAALVLWIGWRLLLTAEDRAALSGCLRRVDRREDPRTSGE